MKLFSRRLGLRTLLTAHESLVLYCTGRECDESILLGVFLKDQGFTNVLIYAGGYAGLDTGTQTCVEEIVFYVIGNWI